MVKPAEGARVDKVRNLMNKILVEVIQVLQHLSTIVNSWGKGNALEGENYWGLKLTNQILEIFKRVGAIFILDRITGEIIGQKRRIFTFQS